MKLREKIIAYMVSANVINWKMVKSVIERHDRYSSSVGHGQKENNLKKGNRYEARRVREMRSPSISLFPHA